MSTNATFRFPILGTPDLIILPEILNLVPKVRSGIPVVNCPNGIVLNL